MLGLNMCSVHEEGFQLSTLLRLHGVVTAIEEFHVTSHPHVPA